MVNGNYILYGDRPCSESEIVNDHVQTRTAERKNKRKFNRNANELQRTLNMAQLDNETDSVKYEKKVKEPRLLRYVPTTDVKENFVTEKFETYDLKPHEEQPRRYSFQKKPKNPSDGSINYAYSRSSSSCSSPNTNLPTISEHGEQYGTYNNRVHSIPNCSDLMNGYEKKMEKYFTKSKIPKNYAAKVGYEGSHPDSLYRVQTGVGGGMNKMTRVLRVLRWPLALVLVCIALAVFVYFLMPEHIDTGAVNSTYWEPVSDSRRAHAARKNTAASQKQRTYTKNTQNNPQKFGTKTAEIDFYGAEDSRERELTPGDQIQVTTAHQMPSIKPYHPINTSTLRALPIAPVYPTNITPEVQYGNERADAEDNIRIEPRPIETLPEVSTLNPQTSADIELSAILGPGSQKITSKHLKHLKGFSTFEEQTTKNVEHPLKTNFRAGKGQDYLQSKQYREFKQYTENLPQESEEHRGIPLANFTSGHSQLFGISIEDAEKMQSTTQTSVYNTRVSPTLPTWRDSTTLKYPVNYNLEAPQCRSTGLELCRGVLPYDLAGAPVKISGLDTMTMLTQFTYLAARNCSARAKQFICALLEPECSPPPYSPKMPCRNLCRQIKDSCFDQIPKELLSVFSCKQYPGENCVAARAPCDLRELTCRDDSCVSSDWICDGVSDCPGGEDETACIHCPKNEYRCESGGCIQRRWVCDGYADCQRGEDEVGCAARADEEAAGSAPAPAVRSPARVPPPPHAIDETKELLMTSDTNNSPRRNYTRRLSKYRYTHPPRKQQTPDSSTRNYDVFGDIASAISTSAKQTSDPSSTKLDKSINKLEKVLNGAELLRVALSVDVLLVPLLHRIKKCLQKAQAQEADSPESNSTTTEAEEWAAAAPSAHTSPCPPGELRCVDGRCITLAQLCDGTIDCSDHADEDNCYT